MSESLPAMPAPPSRFLYVFLDEAGNLDFSAQGTKFFLLGAITKERPFNAYKELTELKYDLVELGTNVEYFHASENAQPVRNRVFDIIQRNLAGVQVDVLVVEKRKTGPALQPVENFYPRMLGYLLRHILGQYDLKSFQEVIVFTDSLPVQKKREAVEKVIKTTLAKLLPASARYRLLHHDSKSNFDLQIADYCTWAIYRKWNSGDVRSYQNIQPAVRSEFDIFRSGTKFYY
ncbi:MAG: DUF3800 domain-containing protein [Verrucomicrobiota bacterium]